VQEAKGSRGSYVVVADPAAYKANSLTLIHVVSKQFCAGAAEKPVTPTPTVVRN